MTPQNTTTPGQTLNAQKFEMPKLDERPEELEPFFQGKKGVFLSTYVAIYFLWHIFYTLGFFTTKWIYIPLDQYVAISIGATYVLTFLTKRAKKELGSKVPWYDWILMAMAILGPLYIIFHSEQFYIRTEIDTTCVVIGSIFIVAALEGVRRGMGLVFGAMVIFFLLYAMFSNFFPGVLWSTGFTYKEIIAATFAHESGMFGQMGRIFSQLLIVFMLFATTIQVSGAGKAILKIALGTLGHLTGGPAKVAVVASGAFGSVAPAGPANVMITGAITIPMMKKTGQPAHFAAAVESVSSILGYLTPPVMGAVAFIMAEWLEIPYINVILAATVPSIMFFFTLFWMVHFQALNNNIPRLPKAEMPSSWEGIREGWHYILPIGAFVILMAVFHWSPESSVIWSWFVLLIVGQFRKKDRITWYKLQTAMRLAIKIITMIGPMLISIGLVMASLEMTGMTIRFTGLLTNMAGGNQLLLLLLAGAAAFVMGMGMPSLAIYLVLAALIGPALEQSGIEPVAAHLYILYAKTTFFFTPPVMPGVIFTAAIAGARVWPTAGNAMFLAIALFIAPLVIIYNPALLLQGGYSIVEILKPLIPCLIGLICLAGGLQGYLIRKANLIERVMLLVSGLLLIISFTKPYGVTFGICGAVILLLLLVWQGAIGKIVAWLKSGSNFVGASVDS